MLCFQFLFYFSSCETLDNLTESINELFSGDEKTEDSSDEQKGTKISTPKYKRANIDTTIWDLAII